MVDPTSSTCPCCDNLLFPPPKVLVSPTQELLDRDCHDLPTSTQVPLIHAAVAEARNEIARLTLEIGRAELVIEQLFLQKEKARAYVAKHEALLAPIRRLPVELLAEIFTLCLPTANEKPATHQWKASPLLPAQINHHWRNIALSTPRLWSTITVSPSGEGSPDSVINQLRTWIERSGKSLLSLSISCDKTSFLILDTIIPHSERWQSVAFYMPLPMHALLAPVRGRLSSLQTLKLVTRPRPGESDIELNTYEIAPRLTSIAINSSSSSSAYRILPWSQLTTWSSTATTDQCIEILQLGQNIVSATFTGVTLPTPQTLPAAPYHIIPPNKLLTFLRIELRSASAGVLFSRLDLPALRELFVVGQGSHWSHWPVGSFVFLRRSPILETLTLDVSYISLIECLIHAPSVVTLTIIGSTANLCISDDLLRQLTLSQNHGSADVPELEHSPDNTNLLPGLETLVLRGFSFSTSHFLIVPLILSRWNGAHSHDPSHTTAARSLQTIHLDCHNSSHRADVSQELVARLREMRRMGLDISVRWFRREVVTEPDADTGPGPGEIFLPGSS